MQESQSCNILLYLQTVLWRQRTEILLKPSLFFNGIYLQCIENKIYHTFILYSYYIIGITCIYWNDVTYYLILALLHFRLHVCLCECCVYAYVFVYVCVFQSTFDKSQFYKITYLI